MLASGLRPGKESGGGVSFIKMKHANSLLLLR